MLKYVDTMIGMSEVPDEISLCINFSGCKVRCYDCHSPYLQDNIGEILTFDKLKELIDKNNGITCVCLMGGDGNIYINDYAKFIKDNYTYKVAWYTGLSYIPIDINIDYFDYIKTGPYIKDLGGLSTPTTNQRMYRIENITNKFFK